MNESTLWALAIGVGLLGLVLLAIGALAAVYWSAQKKPGETASAGQPDAQSASEPPPQAEKIAPPEEHLPPPAAPDVTRQVGGGFMAWLKAWIFAVIHAGTVGVVLGGLTFFEDMAKANEEIQRTGTVSFPRQLLPGTVTGATVRKRLSQSPDGLLETGATEAQDSAPPDAQSPDGAEWEVVDILDNDR